MAATVDRTRGRALHPVHAVLLASTIPLFLGAMLSDIAYMSSYQVQWVNFASWLIVGGLIFGGFALLCALIERFRGGRPLAYLLLLIVTWLLGFINALIHARDAWASMPLGFILSAAVMVLAIAATWVGFSASRAGETR